VALGPDADPESVARKILLDQLTGRARTRHELAAKLTAKGVPDEIAGRLLDRFTEVGLIDDEEYARMLVRTRHAERGLSRRAISVELRRRGIDDDLALAALDEVDDAQEAQAARALVRKRLASTRGLDPQVRARRTFAALGRKGYPPGLVSMLVREELAAEGADVEDEDLAPFD
jgi:regulatory protein